MQHQNLMLPGDEHKFYASHSAMTDPGAFQKLLDHAPDDERELARWVRNVQFHEMYAEQAALALPNDAAGDAATSDPAVRYLEPMLGRIIARDDRSLDFERPKDKCFIGICRDYAVMLCALFRHQGRPARVRCGFAFYYEPEAGFGADHWVTEVWDTGEARWRLIDAEVDSDLPQHETVVIDPFDVPRDQFQVAGMAWKLCQGGKADPGQYGVMGMGNKNQWFMAANVLRDLAALNKHEMTAFDYWGFGTEMCLSGQVTEKQRVTIDELAGLIADRDVDFERARQVYGERPDVRVSDPVKSWPKGIETDFTLGLV
jgi:hypothetical protein